MAQLLRELDGGGGHRAVIGTPGQVADTIEAWFRAEAADGFNLMPDAFPSGLDTFVDEVVPLLRKRGSSATNTRRRPCVSVSRCRFPSTAPRARPEFVQTVRRGS